MADMICHQVYELLMSILRMISQELEFDSEVRKIFGTFLGTLI
jgi:hypothetical protein